MSIIDQRARRARRRPRPPVIFVSDDSDSDKENIPPDNGDPPFRIFELCTFVFKGPSIREAVLDSCEALKDSLDVDVDENDIVLEAQRMVRDELINCIKASLKYILGISIGYGDFVVTGSYYRSDLDEIWVNFENHLAAFTAPRSAALENAFEDVLHIPVQTRPYGNAHLIARMGQVAASSTLQAFLHYYGFDDVRVSFQGYLVDYTHVRRNRDIIGAPHVTPDGSLWPLGFRSVPLLTYE